MAAHSLVLACMHLQKYLVCVDLVMMNYNFLRLYEIYMYTTRINLCVGITYACLIFHGFQPTCTTHDPNEFMEHRYNRKEECVHEKSYKSRRAEALLCVIHTSERAPFRRCEF